MVSRILRNLGDQKSQIIVLNDEAHHCYQDRPLPAGEKARSEEKQANGAGQCLVQGLQAITKYEASSRS